MKKVAISLLIVLVLCSSFVFATDGDEMTPAQREAFKLSFGYEPYSNSEFPDWAHKVRRFEAITLGATVITYPILNAALSTTMLVKDDATKDFFAKFGIALGAGVVVAIIDLIIDEVSR